MADGGRPGAGAAARADGAARLRAARPRWACCTSPTTTPPQAQDILDHLGAELPEVTDWSGTVGVGIASNNVEYFDEPALAVMLCALPSDQYRVFSGVAPLGVGDGTGFEPHTALVHADAAHARRGRADRRDGGAHRHRLPVRRPGLEPRRRRCSSPSAATATSRARARPAACSAAACRAWRSARACALVSRVTQGCQPVAPRARASPRADGNVLLELDGEPALDVLLDDLGISLDAAAGGDGARCAPRWWA